MTNKPIDVNGDKTPFSHQDISQVDSNTWSELSISDLYEQRISLEMRLHIASNSSMNTDTLAAMQRGINQLNGIIQFRTQEELDNEAESNKPNNPR